MKKPKTIRVRMCDKRHLFQSNLFISLLTINRAHWCSAMRETETNEEKKTNTTAKHSTNIHGPISIGMM